MSDDVLSIIPTDQDFVPSPEAQQTAVALLQEMLPDGEMCKADVYDHLHFVDQGANCEAVFCSSCGRRLALDPFTENDPGMSWWYEVNDAIPRGGAIEHVRTAIPCCGASVLSPRSNSIGPPVSRTLNSASGTRTSKVGC